jgi:transposase-like protein
MPAPTCKRFGYFGKRRIQRWRCNSCSATFAEPQSQSLLGTMRTSTDAAAKALHCLLEGCSTRSTERLTGLNRNTIMRLLIVAGESSARLMHGRMRGLKPDRDIGGTPDPYLENELASFT